MSTARKPFFFEKKKQKDFYLLAAEPVTGIKLKSTRDAVTHVGGGEGVLFWTRDLRDSHFHDERAAKQESKRFFFEKKKQKTFIPWLLASRCRARSGRSGLTARVKKFFASFFQKRSACFLSC
jgi:hypothetical protein